MQLVATEYLFIHFPDHHEGHLTVRSIHKIIVITQIPLKVVVFPTPAHAFFLIYYKIFTCFYQKLQVCFYALYNSLFYIFLPVSLSHQVSGPPQFLTCLHTHTHTHKQAKQKNLFSFLSRCTCVLIVLRVMGIVMRPNCSVVFNNKHIFLCTFLFVEPVNCLKK